MEGPHFNRYIKLRPVFDALASCRHVVQTRSLEWDFETQRCFQAMDLYDSDLLRYLRRNTATGHVGEVLASRFFYQVTAVLSQNVVIRLWEIAFLRKKTH